MTKIDRRGEKQDDHNQDDHVVDDHIGDDHVGDDYVGDDYVGDDHVGDDHVGDDHVGDDHVGDDHVVGFLLRQFDKIEEQIEEERNKISQQMNSVKTELEANCKAAAKEVVAFEDPSFAVK